MRPKTILATCALAILCGCTHRLNPTKPYATGFRSAESFAELIGLEVRNLQNEKLGNIAFITADLENARLVEVIVTATDGSTKAVPPRALSLDEKAHVIRLNASSSKFAAAPDFDTTNFAANSQRGPVARVNRYFGLEPWFFTEGQKVTPNTQILRLGYVRRTDQIHRLPIVNEQGQQVGKVGTLMMDLPKGQIVHVVMLGTTGKRSIIQARSLKYSAGKSALVLDSSHAEIAGEPRFNWLNSGKTSFEQQSYVNREVEADKGLHSQQNEQSGMVSNAKSMEQGENFRDEQKNARINQAIQADPKLSANAKDIEVVTHNAQTTLRGHVNTAEDKARIGAIAAAAGRPENVSNLLEVRPLTAR
ncbi:MAG: PRC-barrel domain-containing protein [Roseimicrobium sp.]